MPGPERGDEGERQDEPGKGQEDVGDSRIGTEIKLPYAGKKELTRPAGHLADKLCRVHPRPSVTTHWMFQAVGTTPGITASM